MPARPPWWSIGRRKFTRGWQLRWNGRVLRSRTCSSAWYMRGRGGRECSSLLPLKYGCRSISTRITRVTTSLDVAEVRGVSDSTDVEQRFLDTCSMIESCAERDHGRLNRWNTFHDPTHSSHLLSISQRGSPTLMREPHTTPQHVLNRWNRDPCKAMINGSSSGWFRRPITEDPMASGGPGEGETGGQWWSRVLL